MNDFDYDVYLKKRVARGAFARKRGSKSKKCSLSTDHMTRKQWERMNGQVYTYELSKPMGWQAFKAAPKQIQEEYLNGLKDKYGVNIGALIGMFGVSRGTVSTYFKSSGLKVDFPAGNKMNARETIAWDHFLHGSPDEPDQEPEVQEAIQAEPEIGHESEQEGNKEDRKEDAFRLNHFILTFSGELNPLDIANAITRITGGKANGTLTIDCSLGGVDD